MNYFPQTASKLLPILEELRRREPIFHRPAFPTVTSSQYWEIGASGCRYSRASILQSLAEHPPVDAEAAGWELFDFALQQLGADSYLLTYTLNQQFRLSRRATLWHSTPQGWQILYHQGTLVAAQQDTAPQP